MRATWMAVTFIGSIVPAAAADLRYFDDACLRSVQFVDGKEGFAVGDEGVLWHTIDAGKTWERHATGVRATLKSVCFTRPYIGTGWIAGREELPGGGSVGVLLYTRDGGVKWKRLLPNSLPGLNQVKFIDDQVGFLIGDCTEQFPSGVFKTEDGGASWEPVKGPRFSSWLAGEFQDAKTGILAGTWSRLASFRPDRFDSAQVDSLGGRSILGMHVLRQEILAVGQGGLLLKSKSGGVRWGFVDTRLPTAAQAAFDFQAIVGVGSHIWVAGRPGSAVLHSADQGQSWQLQKTGQPLPLHALHFHDAKQGWAVGEAGTILATVDGGATWKLQRQGGKRAAALLVHAESQRVPLDALARLGADEGYLSVAMRITAPDPISAPAEEACAGQRFSAACRRAGALGGEMFWQFPLPSHLGGVDKLQLLEHWNQLHGGQAGREMLRQLVLGLRTWRPSVVLCDAPEGSMSTLIAEAIREATKQAGDAKAFPEQLETLGLEPWQVARVYANHDKNGHILFDNNKASGRLQASCKEFAELPHRLLGGFELPQQRHFRLLHSLHTGGDTVAHPLDGLAQAEGDSRRVLGDDVVIKTEILEAIRARRNLLLVANKIDDPAKTLAQIAPVLNNLPDEQAAAAAFDVGNLYARRGQWYLARETFLLLVDRFPAHPLAAEAYRWLIRHASSSEARRRHELGQFIMSTTTSVVNSNPPGPVQQVKAVEPTTNGNLTLLRNKEETRHWYRGSLEIGARLAGFGTLYALDPSVQFCIQSSRRHLGEFDAAQQWFSKYMAFAAPGPWQSAAAAELWLTRAGGPPPKPVALCRGTEQRPYLDGKLDDACWQGHKPLLLDQGHDGLKEQKEYAAEAFFTYDQEFLYIAVRCRNPQQGAVKTVSSRPRDANLDGFDRVSILLDLDRDYGTYFQLVVDQRGCVREDCWGDITWNPRWFVAASSTATEWCVEAAMPMHELTGDRILPNSCWACNVVRTLPGRGVLAWSLPANATPRPEGMGLLIFQPQQK